MKNFRSSTFLILMFLLMSCNEQKKIDANKKKKVQVTNPCDQPYVYLNAYKHGNITLECFDLNQLSIEDIDKFVYGYHYFCDRKNAEIGGSDEVFANGIVKINNKIEILEPLLSFGPEIYYINENYLIKAYCGSQLYQKGNPPVKITVFDLKKKLRCTSSYYFSWFCEA